MSETLKPKIQLMEDIEPPPDVVAKIIAGAQDSKLHLPKRALSATQVEMYLRCPRQYYFRYVKGESRPPGVALTLGSGTHKALEATHNHIVDKGVPASAEMVSDVFSDAFEAAVPEVPKIEWEKDESTPDQVKDAGLALVRLYNAKFAPLVKPQVTQRDGKQVRGIEKQFGMLIAGVPVIGFIDLVDTNDPSIAVSPEELALMKKQGQEVPAALRTVVVDFKTKAKSFSQGDVDSSLQLTLYSYAEHIPAVRFDQLLRQKTPTLKRISAVRRETDYRWLEEVIRGVAESISLGAFPPCDPSSWVCSEKWCGFWSLCRGKKL
jgi:CRISPR/Cas system-associated exonuclease Cas4 (RecB family)